MSQFILTCAIDLEEAVSNIETSLIQNLWGYKDDECPTCKRKCSQCSNAEVGLADCLVVHLDK